MAPYSTPATLKVQQSLETPKNANDTIQPSENKPSILPMSYTDIELSTRFCLGGQGESVTVGSQSIESLMAEGLAPFLSLDCCFVKRDRPANAHFQTEIQFEREREAKRHPRRQSN
jgi:hypothetical protein